ncbi:hypothetical protein KPH14_000950 [Odynerus spinipes]|uniref:Uncharacterized protein n=1 Tax=Odynerus spinipes TaxID=1348599 RepID=A0AAD9VL80_9HYME|nr:hypothetical protein KPH14_000950 [Odynerus spinipes]
MAGMMTLAKEVRTGRDGNTEYLEKRWTVICATQGIENKVGDIKRPAIIDALLTWQTWIKPRTTLRAKFLDYMIQGFAGVSPFALSVLEQIRMVLREYGLKSIYLMEAFITRKNRALELAPVAQQAVDLKAALQEQRALHREKFAYLKLYPLEGADTLNHRNFPDLYYAAVKTAIEEGQLGEKDRYAMSEVQTMLSKAQIENMAGKSVRARSGIDEQTKRNLQRGGVERESGTLIKSWHSRWLSSKSNRIFC